MLNAPRYLLIIVLFLSCLKPDVPRADQIIMKNGDRITGKIQSMDTSTIKIKISYAGNVEIDREEIEELTTDTPIRVMLKDKSITFGDLSKSSKSPVKITDTVTGSEHLYDFKDISYINPPPHISGEGTTFTGEINFGGEFKEGNTVSTKLALDFKSQFDRGIRRYLFNGNSQWESKNRTKSEDNWFIQGRYNRLFTPRWYTLGNMSMEFDEFKGLKLRSVTGGGAGYRFIDEEHKKFSLEGGPSFVYENYKETSKSYNLSFREGCNLEYPFFRNKLFFYHNHSVLQGISDTRQLSLRTSSGIKIPLGILGIHTALQLDWNWDKKPSPGRQKSDTTLTVKGGYGW